MCNFSVRGCFGYKYQKSKSQASFNGTDMDWLLSHLQVEGEIDQIQWLKLPGSVVLCSCVLTRVCMSFVFRLISVCWQLTFYGHSLTEAQKILESFFSQELLAYMTSTVSWPELGHMLTQNQYHSHGLGLCRLIQDQTTCPTP